MSVQNPERVVTKQDLADFYQGILPYLGGMPEMLANKFSKGDMYSTDEKMIGQWIDGKPLYQKSVDLTLISDNDWHGYNHNISNFDKCIEAKGWFYQSGEYFDIPYVSQVLAEAMPITVSSQKIFIKTSRSVTAYVTLKYTKTTDSAVSIGNDTDYSTDEKIVGTWIDGRPIWQKTVSGTMPAAGSDTKISVSSDTIDFVLTCKGTVPEYRTQPLSDYLGTSAQTIFLIMTFFDTEEQKVYLRNTGVPAAQNKTAYVTVTYVKATS